MQEKMDKRDSKGSLVKKQSPAAQFAAVRRMNWIPNWTSQSVKEKEF